MTSTSWRDDFRRIVKGRAIAYQQNGSGDPPAHAVRRRPRQRRPAHHGGRPAALERTSPPAKVGGQSSWSSSTSAASSPTAHHRLRGGAHGAALQGAQRSQPQRHHRGLQCVARPYPDQGLSVAVLCNTTAANGTQLGHAVADVFLGRCARRHPPQPRTPTVDRAGGHVSQHARSLRNESRGRRRCLALPLRTATAASWSASKDEVVYEKVEPLDARGRRSRRVRRRLHQ